MEKVCYLKLNRVAKGMAFFSEGQNLKSKMAMTMLQIFFEQTEVNQTGLFVVELTPLILFSCDHLSLAITHSSIGILGCHLWEA